jgi:hypothetical protein
MMLLAGCSSTQIGAIGECIAAAGILEGSIGRLSPFKPVADDDGMDLLLFDKLARKAVPLQIKTRRSYDDPKAQTVQFDVRLKTFARQGEGYVLCVKLHGIAIDTLWLVPAAELASVAKKSSTHLIIVPSAKPASKDRFTPYRMKDFCEVADRIITRL